MDFNKYYLDQANGYPVFRGAPMQRGYGLGNVFRRFISWAMPFLKEYGLPVAKNIGKEIITNAASVANDAIEGKDIKESATQKFKTSLEKLTQRGKGIKRKRNLEKESKKAKIKSTFEKLLKQKSIKRKRKLDVFDK